MVCDEWPGWRPRVGPDCWTLLTISVHLGDGVRGQGSRKKLCPLYISDGPQGKGLWNCNSLETRSLFAFLGFVWVLSPPTEVSVTNWLPNLTKYPFKTPDYTGKYMQSGKYWAAPCYVSPCVMGPGRVKTKLSFPFMWAVLTSVYRYWGLGVEHSKPNTYVKYACHGDNHATLSLQGPILPSVDFTHRWQWLFKAFWLRSDKQALTLGWQEKQPHSGAGWVDLAWYKRRSE